MKKRDSRSLIEKIRGNYAPDQRVLLRTTNNRHFIIQPAEILAIEVEKIGVENEDVNYLSVIRD